jgi:hypothetical protein
MWVFTKSARCWQEIFPRRAPPKGPPGRLEDGTSGRDFRARAWREKIMTKADTIFYSVALAVYFFVLLYL